MPRLISSLDEISPLSERIARMNFAGNDTDGIRADFTSRAVGRKYHHIIPSNFVRLVRTHGSIFIDTTGLLASLKALTAQKL